jgi:prevent-host-death family protein
MRAEPLTDAASHLAELADEVESTHSRVALTRPGHVDVVLLSADELVSLEETAALAGDPAAQQEIADAEAAYAAGDYLTGDELRARYGLPSHIPPDPYQVHVAGPAWRSLDRLSPRVIHSIVELIVGRLATSPHRIGKPLTGKLAGLYVARVGEYRVRCRIDGSSRTVIVLHVAHRADTYRSD